MIARCTPRRSGCRRATPRCTACSPGLMMLTCGSVPAAQSVRKSVERLARGRCWRGEDVREQQDVGEVDRVVVPGDAVGVEPVPDECRWARSGVAMTSLDVGRHDADRRGRLQVAPVRDTSAPSTEQNHRSQIGKVLREPVVEGQVGAVAVAHAPVCAARALTKPSMPPLFHDMWLTFHDWLAPSIASQVGWPVERPDVVALAVGVACWSARRRRRGEAVTAAEHPEVVVVGVVLLHVDDDVLDLRQDVGALGSLRVRPAAGRQDQPARRRASRWATQGLTPDPAATTPAEASMPIRTRRRDASTSRACCSLRADQRFPTAPASLASDLVGAASSSGLDLPAHRTRSRPPR